MTAQPYDRTDYLIMGGLALLALILALVMTATVTEALPHLEDEIAYIFQARVFAHGALSAPVPEESNAFFTPFVVTVEGRRVGKYTIGWPLVLALGELFGMGWLVNPVLGALTVAVTYAIGRDLYDRETGGIAAVLAATSPFFLLQSSNFMSHAAGALWAALLFWALIRIDLAREQGLLTEGWATLAGIALGMLALTRTLTAIAVATPVAVLLVVRAIRSPRDILRLIDIYWPFAVLAGLIAAMQLVYLYIVTGSPTTNLYTLVWKYDRVGFGPEFGIYGHTPAQGWFTTRKDLELWVSEMFGWRHASWVPLIPGLVGGVKDATKGRKFWPFVLVAPLLTLAAAYTAYWVGARVYGPRYYYEALAGVVIVAALGLRSMVRATIWFVLRFRGQWPVTGEHIRPIAAPALLVLLAGLLAINATTYLPGRLTEWHGLYGITRQPLQELEQIRETDRVLVVVRGGRWIDYAVFFSLNSPWYDGPIIAVHDHNLYRLERLKTLYPDREMLFYWAGRFSREPFPYDD